MVWATYIIMEGNYEEGQEKEDRSLEHKCDQQL